ncbi:type IV secretion system protein VirB10 [soil metagenome]
MTDMNQPSGRDPRPLPSDQADPTDLGAELRPVVAARSTGGPWLIIGGAVLAGGLLLFWLTARRTDVQRDLAAQAGAPASVTIAAPPAPADFAVIEASVRNPPPAQLTELMPVVNIAQLPPPPPPPPRPLVVGSSSPVATDALQRRRAPALVIDLAQATPAGAGSFNLAPQPGSPATVAGRAGGPAGALGGPAVNPLIADEQFAARASAAEPERAQATMLRNQAFVIPQGAMIPAVLETALNSDLPGFARAVVSRDVRGFDGSTVLIPRGSRVIGQYKSGLAQGQSRAFVIWTRVLRPDGASIQIASSGADTLGRAGLEGEVDRHFFQRFGSSILLSVLNGAVAALSDRPSTQVVIGSSGDAAGLAASAIGPKDIPPTIKVDQGSPIRIFVARDLDFSTVQKPR